MCAMTSQPENLPLTEMSSVIFFIVPMVIIAILYTNMGIAISRASMQIPRQSQWSQNSSSVKTDTLCYLSGIYTFGAFLIIIILSN